MATRVDTPPTSAVGRRRRAARPGQRRQRVGDQLHHVGRKPAHGCDTPGDVVRSESSKLASTWAAWSAGRVGQHDGDGLRVLVPDEAGDLLGVDTVQERQGMGV